MIFERKYSLNITTKFSCWPWVAIGTDTTQFINNNFKQADPFNISKMTIIHLFSCQQIYLMCLISISTVYTLIHKIHYYTLIINQHFIYIYKHTFIYQYLTWKRHHFNNNKTAYKTQCKKWDKTPRCSQYWSVKMVKLAFIGQGKVTCSTDIMGYHYTAEYITIWTNVNTTVHLLSFNN